MVLGPAGCIYVVISPRCHPVAVIIENLRQKRLHMPLHHSARRNALYRPLGGVDCFQQAGKLDRAHR